MGNEETYKITHEQAEHMMSELRTIFDVVRILKANEVAGRKLIGDVEHPCICYEFWKKTQKCDHCISLKTLEEKKDYAKIEFCDDSCFQVFSKYYEVDNQPCVMEMIKKLDDSTFIDPKGYNHLMTQFSSYKDKMYKDGVTAALNRLYYEDKIRNSKEASGVAILDIDDFKTCNDTFGHKAGDEALKLVVNVLKQNVRENDFLVRFGGDEFLIVLPGINPKSFEIKLEHIRKQIHSSVIDGYGRLQVSVSIGAVVTDGTETIESAANRADKLMYLGKTRKNKVITDWNLEQKRKMQVSETEKPLVLIVDDAEMNRIILNDILEESYRIVEAKNGKEALAQVEQYGAELALILLDIVMPEMDGFEVLYHLNEKTLLDNIPVIIISSDDNNDSIKRTYELGAADYIRRPFDAEVVKKRVSNIIKLYQRQRKLQAEIRQQIEDNEKISNMMTGILSHIVEYRNGESGPHVIHVEQITKVLLDELQRVTTQYALTEEDKKMIVEASALHDIGKIGIDEKILNKPGKLTDEEYEIMKQHTVIGARIIEQMDIYKDEPFVHYIYDICKGHHERWDGKGYPEGKKGDEIPIAAQVVSLADVYDALVNKRVYKDAYSHEEAIQMILNGKCGEFNPILLKCLEEAQDKIKMVEKLSQSGGHVGFTFK